MPLRLIKELGPIGLSVSAGSIGTPYIFPAWFDIADPSDPRVLAKYVEVFASWANLAGGDASSDIQIRGKVVSATLGNIISPPTALEWAFGKALIGVTNAGVATANVPIIQGDGTSLNFVASYPNGEGSAMLSLAPSNGYSGIPLQRYLLVQAARPSGAIFSAGTVTLSKIRVYDD